ncbi:MAG TPA: RidA family protein [Bacillota bacterium]|nr:RidA family protein [Clostridiales bacterium]HPT85660.1 RidA family protein [Bacillota bacterium]
MAKEAISTDKAPAAAGPYSQAIRAGGFVFVSGQLGIDPATGELEEGFEAQAERALANLGAVLAAAGLSYGDVVKTTCFLTDMSNFAAFNSIYSRYFDTCKPARSCVAVASLPKGGLVEVEAIAAERQGGK